HLKEYTTFFDFNFLVLVIEESSIGKHIIEPIVTTNLNIHNLCKAAQVVLRFDVIKFAIAEHTRSSQSINIDQALFLSIKLRCSRQVSTLIRKRACSHIVAWCYTV